MSSPDQGPFVVFPPHALLILEERLAEREAEGFAYPHGLDRTGLALRILVAANLPTAGHEKDAG